MKEKFKYLLVAFLTTIILPISVFAKESVELKIDKTDLNIGDEVKVTASVPDKMEAYAIMATLKYDKNVFKLVNDSNFVIKNDESIKYSKETGLINKITFHKIDPDIINVLTYKRWYSKIKN